MSTDHCIQSRGGCLKSIHPVFMKGWMYPQLYYTVTRELTADMDASAMLLSAASFFRVNSRGQGYLRASRHLATVAAVPLKGADCGAFTATLKWNAHYHFTPIQYVRWLYLWLPHWATFVE